MRIETDENGYFYIIMPSGEKRYLLVDVLGCPYYGRLILGGLIAEEVTND